MSVDGVVMFYGTSTNTQNDAQSQTMLLGLRSALQRLRRLQECMEHMRKCFTEIAQTPSMHGIIYEKMCFQVGKIYIPVHVYTIWS